MQLLAPQWAQVCADGVPADARREAAQVMLETVQRTRQKDISAVCAWAARDVWARPYAPAGHPPTLP